jgi:hypothetical protein
MSRLPRLALLLPWLAAPAFAQILPYEFLPDTPPAAPAPAVADTPAPAVAADTTLAAAPPPPANPFLHDETRTEAEARAQTMFDQMDLDHDGFVTLAEMSAYVAARGAKPGGQSSAGKMPAVPAFVKEMFDDADADHDGRISAAESKAAADRGFDETDTNHDGVVSPAERMAATQDVTGNKPPPRKADDMVGR